MTYNEFTQSPIDVLSDALKNRGIGRGARIAIELSYLPARDYIKFREKLPDSQIEDATPLLYEIRMRKTKREIEILSKVGKAAEESIQEAFEKISEGESERDLARYMMNAFTGRGGENFKMLVVGSGPRSCHPNATPTDRAIKRGDLVRVDMIGTYRGYYSDCARTAVMAEPTEKQLRIYGRIAEIYKSIMPKIKPGASTKELYSFYRGLTDKYELMPLRFLGHGLGLGVHEEPYINIYSDIKLEESMVMCIEPLHFVPGVEGYHIEDAVIITNEGAEVITDRMDKSELYIL
jgi:Xaa-Pro aminopeptidase